MTNAEARFNNSLRPRKPEGSLRRTAQDGHLDSHTAPDLSHIKVQKNAIYMCSELVWPSGKAGKQKDLGSSPFRLSFLFKSWGLWTLSCDFAPYGFCGG